MRKIAIANRKGGVGKTTTAVNLSAGLALAGKKVLLVDTDTQGHCARLLGLRPERGLAELMDGTCTPSEAITEARGGLFLLAGSKNLEGVINNISRRDFRVEYVLADALTPYDGKYDFAILDTAPGFSKLNVNALFYVQEVLIPVSMEALAIDGLVTFLEEVEAIKRYSNIEVRYIIPTFYDRRVKKSEEILEQLREHFDDKVTHLVNYSSKLSESSGWGKTIYEYSHRDRTAKDYARIAGALV